MSTEQIAVVDYGTGNLRSVAKALEHVGAGHRIRVTADPDEILNADRVVFPGQGAAGDCMAALHAANLVQVVRDVIGTRPFLGICMGMQVLFEHSDENGGVACIGALGGQVRHLGRDLVEPGGQRLKVPHMGWSPVRQHDATGEGALAGPAPEYTMWAGIPAAAHFYFAHSYVCDPSAGVQVTGSTDYPDALPVAVAADQLFAVQFHPEKSAGHGLQLLRNFLSWDGH